MMNLQQLASGPAVNRLVGKRPDRRWGRACLTTPRSDGYSIASWFDRHSADERLRLVREAILDRKPWSSLLRVYIAKRAGYNDFRAVDMPTVLDQAVLYLLHDELVKHAEDVLTGVAVGFRQGMQMYQTILNAHQAMASRPFVAVLDIANFFGSIEWSPVDRVIDALIADHDVQDLLRKLVRLEVVEKHSGRLLPRRQGIPQGLSVSPVLANLVLNGFDRGVGHTLSKFGTRLRRYSDDICTASRSRALGDTAIEIITDRLERLGLTIKPGTGKLVDVRQEPAVWLGISFAPHGLDVPQATIDAKAARLQAKLEQGVLDGQGVEDSLISLDQHYRRIIGPERAQEVISSIRDRLDLSAVTQSRKEGTARLRELVRGHHHRGYDAYGDRSYRQPDDGCGSDSTIRPRTREDRGTWRIQQ